MAERFVFGGRRMTHLVPRLGWGLTWRLTTLGLSVFAWRAPSPVKLALLALLGLGFVGGRWRRAGFLGTLWRVVLAVSVAYLLPALISGRPLLLAMGLPLAILAVDVVVTVGGPVLRAPATAPVSEADASESAELDRLERTIAGDERAPTRQSRARRARPSLAAVAITGIGCLLLAGAALVVDLELAIPG